MRAMLAVAILAPLAAAAQSAPPAEAGGVRGTITRSQFIQRAQDIAARRFDAIDVNHSGVLTRDQIRAWRQAHAGGGAGPAAQ